MNPVLCSSKSDVWATSPDFFAKMVRRYGPFDLDVCALAENAKCSRFFSPEQDGLQQRWEGCCWCNPPYGKTIGLWIHKAWESSVEGATVVLLLPARVDTRWWHKYVKPYAAVIDFIPGRLRFGDGKYPAPFPSAVVVFRPAKQYRCRWCERPFVSVRTDSKFCSGGCKQAAYRARRVTAISVTRDATEVSNNRTTADHFAPDVLGLGIGIFKE